MRLLLDTQLVIWVATDDPRLSASARASIGVEGAEVAFSVVSVWEVAIKAALGRQDFRYSAAALRNGALRAGWEELSILGDHAIAVAVLPLIHGDPFDRLLVAQAQVEGITLLTADKTLGQYGSHVRVV